MQNTMNNMFESPEQTITRIKSDSDERYDDVPLGEDGLTHDDQDFRATCEDIEVHPSV